MICIRLSVYIYQMKEEATEISDKLTQAFSPANRDANWKTASDVLFVVLMFIEHLLQNT